MKFSVRNSLKISVFSFLILSSFFIFRNKNEDLETIWEKTENPSAMIKQAMQTDVLQRMKKIDQSGPARYFGPKIPAFSRFSHCIGVWSLLKKINASEKEQIAGILHDVSHTVFSHVGDFLFSEDFHKHVQISYQDTIHMKYMNNPQIKDILKKYKLTEKDLDPENPEYKALDQKLPNMCADRIEYNIHTGVLLSLISEKEAKLMVENIQFKDGVWFFTDETLAKKFAELSLYFTQNFWGSKWNTSMNIHLAGALKKAMSIGLISDKDLFSTDEVVMKKLKKSEDQEIQKYLKQCSIMDSKMDGCSYKSIKYAPKFRGIDPFVKVKNKNELKRLSEINTMFKNYYNSVKEWCSKGYEIDILS